MHLSAAQHEMSDVVEDQSLPQTADHTGDRVSSHGPVTRYQEMKASPESHWIVPWMDYFKNTFEKGGFQSGSPSHL